MKPGVLALALLALLLAVTDQASGEGAPVKLCGRDFVRAIVFTCGGSRWRRNINDYVYALAESNEASPFGHESNGFGAEGPEQAGAGRAAEGKHP
ncbi:PREDICTED: relaxin-3-like [Tinamus guttatus]|nr:PREDICTED: relaxin-3-like [Tinamus guttatus]